MAGASLRRIVVAAAVPAVVIATHAAAAPASKGSRRIRLAISQYQTG